MQKSPNEKEYRRPNRNGSYSRESVDARQTFERYYSNPADSRAGGWFLVCVAGFLGLFFLLTWSHWALTIHLVVFALESILVLWGVRCFSPKREKKHVITLDASGVSSQGPKGQFVALSWADVGEFRNNLNQSCIELYSKTESSVIQIEYSMADFGTILARIIEKVPLAPVVASLPVIFKKPFPTAALAAGLITPPAVAVSYGLISWLFFEDPQWNMRTILILGLMNGFATAFAESYVRIHSLWVDEQGFSLTQKFKTTRTTFREVHAIHLTPHGGVPWLSVKVSFSEGQERFVCTEGHDPFIIYQTLRTLKEAWEKNRADVASL